jgi:hypothetical protein
MRLKAEWKDIDPHQKTILSDELGMGVTTYLLALELDFRIVANTLYFVNIVAPSSYFLKECTKNGQKKSPDFVALDSHDRISAFECKGTQQSRSILLGLTENGIAQKSNLGARPGSTLYHALVVGLFIPQFTNKENALIHIRDPENADFDRILETVSHEQQKIAIVQINLAKYFALMGLQSIANALARRTVENNPPLPTMDDEEVSRVTASAGDIFVFQTDLRLPAGALTLRNGDVTAMTFSMTCPSDFYLRLIKSNNLDSELLRFAESAKNHTWLIREVEWGTTLTTPLGFNLSLTYSAQPTKPKDPEDAVEAKREPYQEDLL